jgi:hypothetical protein
MFLLQCAAGLDAMEKIRALPRYCHGRRRSCRVAAWFNVKFSRHAARKMIIARYRRMPRGQLQFNVGHNSYLTNRDEAFIKFIEPYLQLHPHKPPLGLTA